jgi:hypothetical protein
MSSHSSVHGYRDPRCLAEPATGRRSRNPEVRGDGHLPRVVDEIPQPVVVALLRVPRSRHADDHPAVRSRRTTLDEMWAVLRREMAVAVTTTRARRAECRCGQLGDERRQIAFQGDDCWTLSCPVAGRPVTRLAGFRVRLPAGIRLRAAKGRQHRAHERDNEQAREA